MSAERKAAYRRFARHVLGLDVHTLTNDLRARRIERMAAVRVISQADRAACKRLGEVRNYGSGSRSGGTQPWRAAGELSNSRL
jgi:hypothetical protein